MLDSLTLPKIGTYLFLIGALGAYWTGWSERAKVIALLLIGTALRLFIATRNPLAMQYWPMTDDSHYYFQIAHNLASGNGLKHDSFHTTTGFQPLFLFLIAPLFKLIPDKLQVINAVLISQAIIGAWGAWLLYRFVRLIAAPSLAVFALAVWAVSAQFLIVNLNGLETNIALFMLVATLYYYFLKFRGTHPPSPRHYALLGILCGIAFLARIDLGFLIPVLGLDLLWRHFSWGSVPKRIPLLLLMGAAALIPMSPWLIFNFVDHGGILPSSGQAIRFLSAAYGFHLLDKSPGAADRYFELSQIPLDYYWLMIKSGFSEALIIIRESLPLWTAGVMILAGALFSARRSLLELRKLGFLFAFLLIVFFSYTCYIFGYWFFSRYFSCIALGYLLFVFAAYTPLAREMESGDRPLLKPLCVMVALLALRPLLWQSLERVQDFVKSDRRAKFYYTAQWLNQNTPPDAIIGSFQTGITGYYLERRFYGLDGKINLDALHAMQDKRMDRYVQEKGIDYVADWDWILNDLFTRRSEDAAFLSKQQKLWQGPADVYRLQKPSATRALLGRDP
jgi:hypothetical protein